jgi:hypothetical protein
MAIYRFSAQVISRSTGRSATAAAAYRAGSAIPDQRTGVIHDYTRRGGVMHAEIMTPPGTPAWMKDRIQLWNAVEAVEKRKDAQLSREIQLALPFELPPEARLDLVRRFVSGEFVDRGMIADFAIHAPHRQGDNRNHHAHVMLTMRELTSNGLGPKNRDWNARELIEHWRAAWAHAVNRALEAAALEARVDHRTLEDQREEAAAAAKKAREANDNERAIELEITAVQLDREPQPKIGTAAAAMARRGEPTERMAMWRHVASRNAFRLTAWIQLQRDRLEALWDRATTAISFLNRLGPNDKVVGVITRSAEELVGDAESSILRQKILGNYFNKKSDYDRDTIRSINVRKNIEREQKGDKLDHINNNKQRINSDRER